MTEFEKMLRSKIKCDICGGDMVAIWGGGWDNDRLACDAYNCGAEIVFPTSTADEDQEGEECKRKN